MTAARILTVRQPWAWAIIHGGKDVENRTTNIAGNYRGPVLIHVAKAYADNWQSDILARVMNRHPGVHAEPQPWHDHPGEIIGVVDLVDVHTAQACLDDDGMTCSEWADQTTLEDFHLELANPRALDEPIPYKGALGLRKTDFGIEGDWLVEYHEPCKSPCAGVYGCPPECHMDPVASLVATS